MDATPLHAASAGGLPLTRRGTPLPLDQLPALRLRRDWPGTAALPLTHGLPMQGAAPHTAARDAEVAQKFEALIAATLLRSARAADLGDDGLGATAEPIRDMIDNNRAEAITRAAPLGIARLLQQQRTKAPPS